MSNFTTLYNTAGLPTGTIVRGRISDPTWLPMNGGLYLKADYPELDTSQYLTFGNNIVQTATGTTSATATSGGYDNFAHDPTYTNLIAYPSNLGFYLHSSNAGLTWTVRTFPFSPNVVVFVNNLFFIANGGQYSTSSDGITWAATQGFSVGSFTSVQFADYIAGQYVVGGASSGSTLGIISSSSLAGPWTSRFSTGAYPQGNPTLSNARPGLFRIGDLAVALSQESNPRMILSSDGIRWFEGSNLGVGNAQLRFLPSGAAYTGSLFYPSRSTAAELRSGFLRPMVGTLNSEFNFCSTGFTSGSAPEVHYTESAFLGETVRSKTLPAPAPNGYRVYFTPARMIIINNSTSSSIYYLNVDTTRFRLERPLIENRFADDAYIKAA